MPTSTKKEINNFLALCSYIIPISFHFENRPENNQTLLKHGLNKRNVKDIILKLSYKDYCEGPSPDPHYSLDSWIFGIDFNHEEIYIKLQYCKYNDPGDLVPTIYCISFHKSNQKLVFPYKK
jgi:hypothetical protein